MGNKIVYMVLGGLFIFGWYYTGYAEHYATPEGAISAGWYLWTIVAVAMGAGNGGEGGNPFEALVAGVKAFIPSFIAMLVAALVTRTIYEAFINEEGFQAMGYVDTISTVSAVSALVVLAMTCLKRAR
ncbi:MAG: hypothetical protein GTN86_00195 [Xanthomonadales bacterium]|uniref:hypothetical protein n=1 Tax=Hydrogenophaga sp. TaxID=1904254 RepID=UPI0016A7DF04|nr:hypothetical protein [Hydrogenophaga sp.]NIM68904.1 hypothetical protein [Xanthomonadales bacterium]NIN58231.1 hypothetical protein [Xanthomonadales bacterium]NIN73576.1 hypothetical protein [Xanthomonadales bacterium]NIO12280.1 hypothetical protein [Xanthomonadales bacterium]NIP10624.1 hypothetical protein [Xanthomonadales bacterium]